MGTPGLVILWSAGRTRMILPIEGELVLGRRLVSDADDRISASHARLRYANGRFEIEDQGSTNGTFVGGARHGRASVPGGTLVRCGRTLGLVVSDVTPYADRDPAWVRAARGAAEARSHLVVVGLRGSDRMRAAMAYVEAAAVPHLIHDPFVDTRGLVVDDDVGTLVVANPHLLDDLQRARLAALIAERPRLRVVVSTTGAVDGLVPDPAVVRVPPLAEDLPSIIDVLADELADTRTQIHERVVEQCLLRVWPGEALELRAAMIDARRAALEDGSDRIMKKHLRKTAGQPVPAGVASFVDCYESTMSAPPSFPIPDDYLVMIRSDEHEQMIASLHAVEHGPLLTQADVPRVPSLPRGWFQAGFWGHGVNSYAFYLSEVTDRHRTLLRLPYGGGAYAEPDEAADAVAQLARYRKLRSLPPDQLKEALIVDSDDHHYEIERGDGKRFTGAPGPGSLDFDALIARVTLRVV